MSETLNPALQWAEELSSVYTSVEDVDFLVGCLAESPRPEGYIISETAFYVFIMNASRRLLCDRFYQVGEASSPGSTTDKDSGFSVTLSKSMLKKSANTEQVV